MRQRKHADHVYEHHEEQTRAWQRQSAAERAARLQELSGRTMVVNPPSRDYIEYVALCQLAKVEPATHGAQRIQITIL